MITTTGKIEDATAESYCQERLAYWDAAAGRKDKSHSLGKYYHHRLAQIYQGLIARGSRVCEFGCGEADLLAAVHPGYGVGVDFSGEMIKRAQARHPELRYIQEDVHSLSLNETFDVVIISDLLDDLWDVQCVLEKASGLLNLDGRLIINTYSRLWQLPLSIAQKLGLAQPVLQPNWLTVEDITNLEHLVGMEVIRSWQEILSPLGIPLIQSLANNVLVKFWPISQMGLTNFILARPQPTQRQADRTVTVVVPARNEAGNIPEIFQRVPQIGLGTELIFVEGGSKDNTREAILSEQAKHPEIHSKLMTQAGSGKGDAIRTGFAESSGDILMILDADLTVPPENLPRFYETLLCGRGELVNGVRLVYPMEKQAMPFLNFLGNKFFTVAFSWVLGQPIKDTLCGTKVLWKADYERIAANRSYFGDFDPFGDFDLIFGAVKLNRKIVDLPIRYRERKYGTTNIQRWKHGWLLFKMLLLAMRRIKFV